MNFIKLFALILLIISYTKSNSQNIELHNKYTITDVSQLSDTTKLKTVNYLVIDGLDIDTLPNLITKIKGLRELEIIETPLKKLPSNIADLTNLNYLKIQNDTCISIEECVNQVSTITSLQRLDLISLKGDSLPASISELTNLEYLSLRNDHIKHLPKGNGGLSKLKILDLGYNDLSSLNEDFFKDLSLEVLFLDNETQLKSLSGLISVKSLKELHIENSNVDINGLNIHGLERVYMQSQKEKKNVNLNLNNIKLTTPVNYQSGTIPMR